MKWPSALGLSLCLATLPTFAHATPPVEKDAAGTPLVRFDEKSTGTLLGGFYDYSNRDGTNQKANANSLTLGYWQLQPGFITNYALLSGVSSAAKAGISHNDTSIGTLTLGRMWSIPPIGNSTYLAINLGGSKSTDKAGATKDKSVAKSIGINGGFTQVLPVFSNSDNILVVGGAFNISYLDPNNDRNDAQGFTTSLYPSLQLRHSFTPKLSGYAQAAATISNHDVGLSSDHVLYTPNIGFDYAVGVGSIGVKYTREFADDHKGQRVGLSFVRQF